MKLKNIFTILVTLFLLSNTAFASSVKILAETLDDFSTINPPVNLRVQTAENYEFKNGQYVPKGLILEGEILSVNNAKIGKRNACATYKITHFKNEQGIMQKVKNPNLIAKITAYSPLDVKDLSISAGTGVAGFFVKNIAYPINFAKGIIDPDDPSKNRLQSGVQEVYEGSVFSYASKGKEIDIKAGEKLILIFKDLK